MTSFYSALGLNEFFTLVRGNKYPLDLLNRNFALSLRGKAKISRHMILKRISILNYKNLEQVELAFSPKLNTFFGQNGMGKTNLLDAVYFLSFCKSAGNPIDSQNIRHDADFFVIQGFYEAADGTPEEIYCGMKRRQKKQFKRNKKEYTRLSDHIGFLPLVMVSPADSALINGGSDERRRFMDVVISQYDKEYLDALIRYNKALAQRNTLLKSEFPVEEELFLVWEEMMAQAGEVVFRKREAFIKEFIPIFQSFYSFISQDKESVGLSYESHARDTSLLDVLKQSRERDKIMGFSLRGIHKDELNMLLGEFPIKKEGSQGQNKTYLGVLRQDIGGYCTALSMGAGEQRVFKILNEVYSCPKHSLILIDEVDLLLHENALKRMIQKLFEIATNRNLQIVFTTHSMLMTELTQYVDIRYLVQTPEMTLVQTSISTDSIWQLTGTQNRPISIYVEDLLSQTIISKIARDQECVRNVEIYRFGPAINAFTVIAGKALNGTLNAKTIAVLDGDVYKTEEEKTRRIQEVLTGQTYQPQREQVLRAILQYDLPTDIKPESYIRNAILALPEEILPANAEARQVLRDIGVLDDEHGYINIAIERMGFTYETGLSEIINLFAKSDQWNNFTLPIRQWLQLANNT